MEEEKAKEGSQPIQKMGKKTEKKQDEVTIEPRGKMFLQLAQRGREHEAGNFDTIRIKGETEAAEEYKIGQRKAATTAEVYVTRKAEDKEETQKHLQPLRLNKCYDQKRTRRKWGIKDKGTRQKAKAKARTERGGHHKHEKAPRGRMERLLQNMLARIGS